MRGLFFACSLGLSCQLWGGQGFYRFDQTLPEGPQLEHFAQIFLKQAEKLLPPVVRDHLPPLTVVFKERESNIPFLTSISTAKVTAASGLIPLSLPNCGEEGAESASLEEEGDDGAPEEQPPVSASKGHPLVYGDYNHKTHTIRLNPRFKLDLTTQNQENRMYRCGHGSMYRLLLATVIHETAHAYDFSNIRTSAEQKEFAACASDNRCDAVKKFKNRHLSVSDHPVFKKIVHDGLTKALASPDPYERKNSYIEYFAVNFEFWIMDPIEFNKHRPALAAFFREYFGYDPAVGRGQMKKQREVPTEQMGIMTKIPLIHYPTFSEIDFAPNKVERADFFLIAAGSAGESRFGHVSFRFKMCKRSLQPGETCSAEDKAEDLVTTYAADLREATWVNPIKGLSGGYFSATSMVYLPTALDNYAYLESRTLEAYPLKLTLRQKEKLVLQVLTDFWSFEGRYKFISKNCSTEARDILKSILGVHHFASQYPIMPMKLKEVLIKENLIDPKPIHVYTSAVEKIEKRLELAMGTDKKKKYATKLIGLAPQSRMAWYKKHMKSDLKYLDKMAWRHVEEEVSRARQVKETHRLGVKYSSDMRRLTKEVGIYREGYGIPSDFRVVIPDGAKLPYQEELAVFEAAEKAVHTALSAK